MLLLADAIQIIYINHLCRA